MAREYPVRTTLPQPLPRGRLLDTIARLDVGTVPRWASGGVTWVPWPCRDLQAIEQGDMCDVDDLVDENGLICESAVVQKPFSIMDVYSAQILSGGIAGDENLIGNFLRSRFELMRSALFARELANGTVGWMSLRSEATPPANHPFGAAVPVKRGMAILADELGRRLMGGRGIIHMPPSVTEFAAVKESDEENLETPLGHLVVADAGYVDMPEPSSGGTAAGAGEAWIYASGPVWYAEAPVDMGDGTVNISKNTVQEWLLGHGILVFDPCPVTAVRVSLS